jgi:ATP-dependent DNA helicase RecG
MGIRLARFRGKDRLADFSDNRQYWGHAFSLLRRAESFLLAHVPIAGRVVPGKMVREDQPWYPPRATREALANALCHRDYAIPGGAVAVAMYGDHLEITSPGELHFGITPEKLAAPHESRPWNPIIANVFYRAGIIERWGMGTLNIIDWCSENGNRPPVWSQQSNSVFVTFKPPDLPSDQKTDQVTGEVTGEVHQVLHAMKGEMKRQEIQAALGLKHEDHFRKAYLVPTLRAGLIEMTIPDKPRSSKQKYRLTDKSQMVLKRIGVP